MTYVVTYHVTSICVQSESFWTCQCRLQRSKLWHTHTSERRSFMVSYFL